MADTKYLKQRRQGWYFCIAVPRDLREKYGSDRVQFSLKTRDLSVAQKRRWEHVARYSEAFERLRGTVPMTRAEIEEQARHVFHQTLMEMEADAQRGVRSWAEPQRIEVSDGEDGEVAEEDQEVAGLDLAASLFADALEADDFSHVADEIAAAQKRTGAVVDPGSETYRTLGHALLAAKQAAFYGRMNALQGHAYEPPQTFGAPVIDPITLKVATFGRPKIRTHGNGADGMRFSVAAEQFISELQRDDAAKLTEQTRGQYEAVFRLFEQYTKNAPLSAVERTTATEFLEAVSKLHPHWGRSPKTKELTVWQVLQQFGGGEEQLSNRTINRYVTSLAGVFKWARKRGYFNGENPFSEQSRPKARRGTSEWLPFSIEELTKLFQSSLFLDVVAKDRIKPEHHTFDTAMLWVPLIALFSGMRLGEVCQLRTTDVQRERKVWFFNVAEETEGQRVKTAKSIRRVPVHSTLIHCGVLDYLVELPQGQLFPALKPGGPDGKLSWYFTRRFTDYRRGVGVDRNRVSFHSFRKNVGTALDRARTTQSDIAELIGHERGFTLDTYAPLGLELPALAEIVKRIKYPGLPLSHLYVD